MYELLLYFLLIQKEGVTTPARSDSIFWWIKTPLLSTALVTGDSESIVEILKKSPGKLLPCIEREREEGLNGSHEALTKN